MTPALWLMATLALASPALAESPPPPAAVTVQGEGTATAVPDIAIITCGVVTRADDAGSALKANAGAMARALEALTDAGVAERDIGTSGLSVQPQYDYGADGGQRAPRLAGYEARNAVTIRARDVGKLGDLIDALVKAGSNQVEGLAFDVSDREAKLDEARRGAIADARRKAALFAAAADVRLGRVLSIDENALGSEEPPRPFAMRARAMDGAASATPIARGEQELRVRVTARWALEP